MYDAGKIVLGIGIFLVLVLVPFLYNWSTPAAVTAPELKLPTTSTQCVEATDYMRVSHMDLLNQWRDIVVREGRREYVSRLSGKTFDMSLSRTCLDCHSNKAEFCDACHNYLAVKPFCWDCHVEPKKEGA